MILLSVCRCPTNFDLPILRKTHQLCCDGSIRNTVLFPTKGITIRIHKKSQLSSAI